MERARYRKEIQEGIEGQGRRERCDMAFLERGESGCVCWEGLRGLWGGLWGEVYGGTFSLSLSLPLHHHHPLTSQNTQTPLYWTLAIPIPTCQRFSPRCSAQHGVRAAEPTATSKDTLYPILPFLLACLIFHLQRPAVLSTMVPPLLPLQLLLPLLVLLTTAQTPFPFPVLPQVFASRSACRSVYDECMDAFRACLAAVGGGSEPARLACEAYRQDVCEDKIRVGCDRLPNSGGGGGLGSTTSGTVCCTLFHPPRTHTDARRHRRLCLSLCRCLLRRRLY